MSINEVRYLPECGSTNAYVKEHFEEFAAPSATLYMNTHSKYSLLPDTLSCKQI